MATFNVQTPHTKRIVLPDGTVTIEFRPDFGARMSGKFDKAQAFVDNEVLRYSQPLIPFRTGMLVRSGKVGTVLGSGLVQYITPYARFQYYKTAQSRSYDSRRGAKWFERMKTAHRDDILSGAKKIMKEGSGGSFG